jgi:hypothetical protein
MFHSFHSFIGNTLFNFQVIIDSEGTILGIHQKLQQTYFERYIWLKATAAPCATGPSSWATIWAVSHAGSTP